MPRLLAALSVAVAALNLASPASAQLFPTKPVRIVVAYAAGGPVDTVARVAAQNLTAIWGQQVVIDNRAGSGGALGTQAVVKAPPDGYTLLVTNSGPITAYPHLRKSVLYDFDRDLTPVSLLSTSSLVLVIHPSLPAKTIPEFVALAKKNPGQLSYATSGVGGIQHLALVLLESRAGIRLTHVPYKGGSSATVDILSGQVPVNFNSVLGALPFVQAGKLRALGVTTAQPSLAMPGVPTFASVYPRFELTSWLALYAPPGMPAPLVEQLNRDVTAALNVPESKRRLNDLGLELVGGSPAELRAYTRAESVLLGKLMATAGIEKE
jgi:tripartite-type tricarboxylate transporter receptor subunit TctC